MEGTAESESIAKGGEAAVLPCPPAGPCPPQRRAGPANCRCQVCSAPSPGPRWLCLQRPQQEPRAPAPVSSSPSVPGCAPLGRAPHKSQEDLAGCEEPELKPGLPGRLLRTLPSHRQLPVTEGSPCTFPQEAPQGLRAAHPRGAAARPPHVRALTWAAHRVLLHQGGLVALRSLLGHDGEDFFVQAPLVVDVEAVLQESRPRAGAWHPPRTHTGAQPDGAGAAGSCCASAFPPRPLRLLLGPHGHWCPSWGHCVLLPLPLPPSSGCQAPLLAHPLAPTPQLTAPALPAVRAESQGARVRLQGHRETERAPLGAAAAREAGTHAESTELAPRSTPRVGRVPSPTILGPAWAGITPRRLPPLSAASTSLPGHPPRPRGRLGGDPSPGGQSCKGGS